MSSLLMIAGGSIRPAPGPARSWLERELSRPAYHQSLVDQFLSWLRGLWEGLRTTALGAAPLSTAATALVIVVLVVLAALVVGRVRREPAGGLADDAVLVSGQLSPQAHRSAAEAALADGAYDLAIVEAFRALATRSVQRGLVDERPGLTAHELADDLGPVFPDHADELLRSSVLFDLVFYGDQPATEADARTLLAVDATLRVARPARPTSGLPGPTAAVPR